MSEKVVLTQEQANAIKEAISIEGGNKGRVLRFQGMSNCTWRNGCSPLNEMSFEKVARALFVGYEIEKPKFQVGDFVVMTYEATGRKIKEEVFSKIEGWVLEEGGAFYLEKGHFGADSKNARHATEEEIYWLHELGREKVRDFKVGDVFVDRLNAGYRINSEQNMEQFIQYYEEDDFIGIYPAESFKPFKKEQTK